MGILHSLRYEHVRLTKDGVGEFGFCYHKRKGQMRGVMFKPDLPGAMPHAIPDPTTMSLMLNVDTAIEAMSILRLAEGAN